jgi:hypothetical protein
MKRQLIQNFSELGHVLISIAVNWRRAHSD